MDDATSPPLFPMTRESPFDPPPLIISLQAKKPISRVRLANGQESWLVTGYDNVRAVLTNKAFSADVAKPGYPRVSEALATFTEGLLNHMDGPEHDEYRRMLAPEFMLKRVNRLEPEVQQRVDALLDRMIEKGPPADLVADFAFPLPAQITCALLGVPFSDQAFFVECAESFLGQYVSAEESAAASKRMRDYLDQLISDKVTSPTDDLLGYMASEHVATGQVSRPALVTIAQLLLSAGFDTTANMIALGLLTLLQHPDQIAMLKQDPALVPAAVEELLRFLTITHRGRHRAATEDVEIDGQLIRAGEGVIVAQDAANRDPAAFDDPDRLDITRENRRHVAFGYGVHQCIGASLARLELQVAYTTLLRRLPDIQVAVPLDELAFRHDYAVYGLVSLPVSW